MSYSLAIGGPKAVCDVCAFTWNLSRLRKQWNGLMACPDCFDTRHPQEFVKARPDRQGVRPNMRPEPADSYVDLLLAGSDLTSSSWGTTTNVTTVADAAANASYSTLLDTLHDGTATGSHLIAQNISSVATRTYRLSGTVRAKDHTWFQIGGGSAIWGTTFWVNFRALGDGAVGNKGSAATGASITPLGNGCYRFAVVGVATTTASTDAMFIALTNNTDTSSRLPSYAGSSSGLYFGELSYMRILQASEL